LGEFLFGTESHVAWMANNADDAVRKSLTNVGIGDWAETLLGPAPERPWPHARLMLTRTAPNPVAVDFGQMQSMPAEPAGPEDPRSDLVGYNDCWISCAHYATEAKGTGCSDLRSTGGVGAHAELVPESLTQAVAHCRCWAWLASAAGDPAEMKRALVEEFPRLAAWATRLADVGAARFGKQQLDATTMEVTLDIPLDLAEATKHYPRTAQLLALFEPLVIKLQDPGSGSVLLDFSLQEKSVHLSLCVRDGFLAWRDPALGPVDWDSNGEFVMDAVVDCSIVPLGISYAVIPMPRMVLRCLFNRVGKIVVTCVEAGEPTFPTVAAAAFDVDLFRDLLLEGLRAEVEHVKISDAKSAVRLYGRIIFPSGSVARIISSWFQNFALDQFGELDCLVAMSDFWQAASEDFGAFCAGSAL